MNYSVVDVRFQFWNGKDQFTVEYCFGISMWFVFKNKEYTNCLYKRKEEKIKPKDVNFFSAQEIFKKFIDL